MLPSFDQGGERQNPSLLCTLWETPFSSPPLAAALPRARQLVGGCEKLTTYLLPGVGRVTVLRRMTGEKKKKNSHLSELLGLLLW